MLNNDNDLGLTRAQICGKTFLPADDDNVFAVFDLGSCACGVTVEKGSSNPYLRLTPSVMVPPEARDGFRRFLFEHDDDMMLDLGFDEDDGEVTLRRDLGSLDRAEVEQTLAPLLEWVGKVAYPAIMGYVAEKVAEARGEE